MGTGTEAFLGELRFLVDPVIVAQLMDPFARAQIEPEDVARARPLPSRETKGCEGLINAGVILGNLSAPTSSSLFSIDQR